MKRELGISVDGDGNISLHEENCFKCICIEGIDFMEAILVGPTSPSYHNPLLVNDKWIKGNVYDYYVQTRSFVTNPYGVFINDTNSTNNFTKKEFDKHFMSLVDYRNNLIDDIIK